MIEAIKRAERHLERAEEFLDRKKSNLSAMVMPIVKAAGGHNPDSFLSITIGSKEIHVSWEYY